MMIERTTKQDALTKVVAGQKFTASKMKNIKQDKVYGNIPHSPIKQRLIRNFADMLGDHLCSEG